MGCKKCQYHVGLHCPAFFDFLIVSAFIRGCLCVCAGFWFKEVVRLTYWPFRSSVWLGVDIQPDGIYMIKLIKNKKSYLVEQMAYGALPVGVIEAGKVRHGALLKGMLLEMTVTHGFQGLKTAIALPAQMVRRERLRLPWNNVNEETVKAALKREWPEMTGEIRVDFLTHGQVLEGLVQVSVTAAREKHVCQYEACVREAGLDVKVVDVDIYALQRALCWNFPHANALLYGTDHSVTLLGFDEKNVLVFHQWEVDDRQAAHEPILASVQTYQSLYPQLPWRGMVAAGLKDEWRDWQACPLYHKSLFAGMDVSETAQLSEAWVKRDAFAVALGLAMHVRRKC